MSATTAGSTCCAGSYPAGVDGPSPRKNMWSSASWTRIVTPVGYQQHAIWLDEDELHALIGELRAAIVPRRANEPPPDRARYMLSPILFPGEPPESVSR